MQSQTGIKIARQFTESCWLPVCSAGVTYQVLLVCSKVHCQQSQTLEPARSEEIIIQITILHFHSLQNFSLYFLLIIHTSHSWTIDNQSSLYRGLINNVAQTTFYTVNLVSSLLTHVHMFHTLYLEVEWPLWWHWVWFPLTNSRVIDVTPA